LKQSSNGVFKEVAVEPSLVEGARNAVVVCLRIQPHEKVTLITDHASIEIAAALAAELDAVGAPYRSWMLEEIAPRPLADMPQPVLDDLETSQVSIFAAQAQANELRSRMQMTEVVTRRKIRHAHMVNITKQIMRDGMRADFREVDRISLQVIEIARAATLVRARTPDQRHHQPEYLG
jgi:aminopeptidase